MEGNASFIEAMIRAGAYPNAKNSRGFTPLHFAAKSGDINGVKLLIKLGVSIDSKSNTGETALHFAALGDHAECCECLLDSGAEVNSKNKELHTPLTLALSRQGMNSARVLIARGGTGIHDAPLKPIESNKIHIAYDFDFMALRARRHEAALNSVRILISSGATATMPDLNGCTPLHICFLPDYFDELELDIVHFYSGIADFDD